TLGGCGPSWQATVVAPNGDDFAVDRQVLEDLERFAEEGAEGVPLEQVLWTAGHQAVETVVVADEEGARHEFDWAEVALEAQWLPSGTILVAGEELDAVRVEVEPPALLARVTANITDVAPTAAAGLGLDRLAASTGEPLPVTGGAVGVDHVLLLFLDGFGYVRYTEATEAGLIPNLAALGEPMVGLTVYPPCTSVGSAALLTGAPPSVNGVDQRGIRTTEVETLFDAVAAAGLEGVAVEGDALAFNLRNATLLLSGDRDGNGSTDDNVLANALAVLEEGMPNLFYVHFHGIDDAGHTYGPGAPEEQAAIQGVDAAVGQLLDAVPGNTLIVIFADHGMHQVEGQEKQGNHEHLIERDMFIPIIVVVRG
ncbi:MAG: alkaline phosphatase family protein, partial [Anaerolineae bacterium]